MVALLPGEVGGARLRPITERPILSKALVFSKADSDPLAVTGLVCSSRHIRGLLSDPEHQLLVIAKPTSP